MKSTKVLAGLSALAGLAVVMSVSTGAQDTIAKRRELMKGVGAATKLASEMIKGDRPFDAAAASEASTKIATHWTEFVTMFPKGSETGGETTAAAKIWENFGDFQEKGAALAKTGTVAATEAAKGPEAFKASFAR